MTRRQLLQATAAAGSATLLAGCACCRRDRAATPLPDDLVIDIHQHTNYSGRTDEQLIAHQQAMGVGLSVLLPAGMYVKRTSTHQGKSNGLAAAIGTNDAALQLVRQHPGRFRFFANEVPDLPEARQTIEKYLKLGAMGIGELKFNLDCDGPDMQNLYAIARAHRVPVLLHFQHGMYNHGYDRLGKMLEKWHDVAFIGHAQTFWANIDAGHTDQAQLYPKAPVTRGGMTDRYLTDYPNMYGDLSAGSGLNALLRDEGHARDFLLRHQDKLLYGSDCNDPAGSGEKCQGSQTLAALARLVPDPRVRRKLLRDNAVRVLRLA